MENSDNKHEVDEENNSFVANTTTPQEKSDENISNRAKLTLLGGSLVMVKKAVHLV